MAQEWTKDAIIHTIKESILIGQLQVGNGNLSAANIPDNMPLLAEGLDLDSVDALDLLVAVEQRFQIKLPDLSPAFLDTQCRDIAALADYVLGQRTPAAAGTAH